MVWVYAATVSRFASSVDFTIFSISFRWGIGPMSWGFRPQPCLRRPAFVHLARSSPNVFGGATRTILSNLPLMRLFYTGFRASLCCETVRLDSWCRIGCHPQPTVAPMDHVKAVPRRGLRPDRVRFGFLLLFFANTLEVKGLLRRLHSPMKQGFLTVCDQYQVLIFQILGHALSAHGCGWCGGLDAGGW